MVEKRKRRGTPRDVKPYVRLSPELVDGHHWRAINDKAAFLESVGMWWNEFHDQPGESFSVDVIEMTEAEVEALPDI